MDADLLEKIFLNTVVTHEKMKHKFCAFMMAALQLFGGNAIVIGW